MRLSLLGGSLRFKPMKAITLGVLLTSLASAANFSFQGTFTQDDQVQLFNFTVASTSTVTLRTWSYAGGVNAAGVTIARGGFDPIFALFNSSGVLIGENDDGNALVPADSVTGQNFDTYFQTSLTAGSYTAAIMQYDNFPNGPNLSNGFANTGNPTFTGAFGCSNGRFCDVVPDNRTGLWAFDILGATSATSSVVPEPGITALVGLGLGVLALSRRRNAFSRN